jgi:cell division septal protein FtsQ
LLFFSSFFQIDEIRVSGNEKISGQELQQLIWPKLETDILGVKLKSIFLANTTKPLQDLIVDKFPAIDSLKVKRAFPQAITIDIVERKPIGLWCWENNCFLIDKKGVIFETGQEPQELVISSKQPQGAIVLGQNIVEGKTVEQILLVQKTMKENAGVEAKEFTLVETEQRLNAKTTEGWEVYFDLSGNINWQLVRLELLLGKDLPQEKRSNLEYIDLRFSKVYYK